jgi:hypothetical protein
MPTVLRLGPHRFFFYAGDKDESEHVHVERDENVAKFWLDPVRLQGSIGFRPVELSRLQRTIEERQQKLVETWNDCFHD